MREKIGCALAGIAVVGLVSFGLWSYYAGPCWLFNYSAGKDIPGRCLMQNGH